MVDKINNKVISEVTNPMSNEIISKSGLTYYSIDMDKVNSLVDMDKNTCYSGPVTMEKFERLVNINLGLINIIMNFFDPSVIPNDLQQLDSELKELKNGG